MKYIFFTLIFCFTISITNTEAQLVNADKNYKNFAYTNAVKKYKRIVKRNPQDGEALFNLGNSYRLLGKTKEAEMWFAKAIQFYDPPVSKLYYSQMLLVNNKYEKAAQWFDNYANSIFDKKESQRAKKMAAHCRNIAKNGIPTSNISLTKAPFNSEKLDFCPTFINENEILFASNRDIQKPGKKTDPWTEDNFVDLYIVKKDSTGTFSSPVSMHKAINSVYHEGPASYVASENALYFTRNDFYDNKREFDDNNNTRLNIYRIERITDGWGFVVPLTINSNEYSNCHPAVSQDGFTLVFASDRPGGHGGMDLYVSKIDEDGIWGEPENLGPEINTSGNEIFPFLHEDGTLYFSSNFLIGYGGLDVFKAKYNGEKWSEPENMNPPINSSKDDFGFITGKDHSWGYLTSNRESVDDEIYYFETEDLIVVEKEDEKEKKLIPPGQIGVCGVVVNAKYENRLPNTNITMLNRCSGEELTATTDNNGEFQFLLKDECDYELIAEKHKFETGYKFFSTIDTTFDTECVEVRIPLTFIETFTPDTLTTDITLRKGLVIELYHVYFDFDKYYIRSSAVPDLDILYKLMKKYPNMEGELSAHTDCRGTHKYNIWLSNQRAKSARNYLIKKGIEPDRLTAVGYGETRLKNHCADGVSCTEKEHQRNRRVEFKVTYFDGVVESKEKDEWVE